jgi:hypothetical protein
LRNLPCPLFGERLSQKGSKQIPPFAKGGKGGFLGVVSALLSEGFSLKIDLLLPFNLLQLDGVAPNLPCPLFGEKEGDFT